MKPLNSMKIINTLFLLLAIIFSLKSFAGVIDFETNALGETPKDNSIISINDQFILDGVSVSFGFDTTGDNEPDSYGVFEQVGGGKEKGNSGFISSYGDRYDIAATGSELLLGNFFLRQQQAYKPFGTLHILYDSLLPVTSASGEIWDIDGKKSATEQFLVQAFNRTNLLASISSPLGDSYDNSSLDGKPWVFGFNGLNDITRIEISFTGSKKHGIGLAFNNFSPIQDVSPTSISVSVSEPSTIIIFALALIGLMAVRQYNKQINK